MPFPAPPGGGFFPGVKEAAPPPRAARCVLACSGAQFLLGTHEFGLSPWFKSYGAGGAGPLPGRAAVREGSFSLEPELGGFSPCRGESREFVHDSQGQSSCFSALLPPWIAMGMRGVSLCFT